jgi:deoxyribose-phosphate aldolase
VLDFSKMIDQSLLHPMMTDEQLGTGPALACRYADATAGVRPSAVPMSSAALAGAGVDPGAVTGFSHGTSHIALQVTEVERAILPAPTLPAPPG